MAVLLASSPLDDPGGWLRTGIAVGVALLALQAARMARAARREIREEREAREKRAARRQNVG